MLDKDFDIKMLDSDIVSTAYLAADEKTQLIVSTVLTKKTPETAFIFSYADITKFNDALDTKDLSKSTGFTLMLGDTACAGWLCINAMQIFNTLPHGKNTLYKVMSFLLRTLSPADRSKVIEEAGENVS